MTLSASPYFRVTAQHRDKYGARLERYLELLHVGDPLADDVVRMIADLPAGEGYRMLRLALDRGIENVPDAPPELRAFFAQLDTVPDWVDWRQIDAGGAAFLRSGILGVFSIALSSLPLSYCSPAGNKVLTRSGRMSEKAMRRLGETGHYVYLASLPGGLRRDSEGFQATVKVRLMHAQMRTFSRKNDWNEDLWGSPVNQCYMSATVLLLSRGLLVAMQRFGLNFSARERQALIHQWRYAGYLLGIMPELQCVDEAAAADLLDMVFELDAEPDHDSRDLISALMGVSQRLGLGRGAWMPRLFYGISETLIGGRRARALGYPESAWKWLVPLLRPAIQALDLLRRIVPGSNRLLNALGRKGWRFVVDLTLGESRMSTQQSGCPMHAESAPARAASPAFVFFTVEIHRKKRE